MVACSCFLVGRFSQRLNCNTRKRHKPHSRNTGELLPTVKHIMVRRDIHALQLLYCLLLAKAP
jgi:hypothetical protein